ncbi:MAG: DUF4124 domain-containing protein [Burkholderiales bacterium]
MTPRLIPALILALAALPAQAGTYKWVDEKGQVNCLARPQHNHLSHISFVLLKDSLSREITQRHCRKAYCADCEEEL